MKPYVPALVVVTATGNLAEALPRIARWQSLASFDWPLVIVENGGVTDLRPDAQSFIVERSQAWLGSVPAMSLAMQAARLRFGQRADVVVALHDDVEIDQEGWDAEVLSHFANHPRCGLAGFSGALGLGSDDIYQAPYSPMQLARQGFRSNLREAEAHGIRSLQAERVICHDGFSLIGRASWWLYGKKGSGKSAMPPWEVMTAAHMMHHGQDSLMGLLAHQAGWESWYLPVACHHLGGRTAVANRRYTDWALTQEVGGDQGYWEQSHQVLYAMGQGILPLRIAR